MGDVCQIFARNDHVCVFFVPKEIQSPPFSSSSFDGVCKEWSYDPTRIASMMDASTPLTPATYDLMFKTCTSACECVHRHMHGNWLIHITMLSSFFLPIPVFMIIVFIRAISKHFAPPLKVQGRGEGPQNACASNEEKLLQ